MADGLRVELSEPNPSAGPGEAATVRCTVYNRSLIVDEYRISVAGVPPDWVDAPAATERIFPESAATAAITFRPPRAATVSAGTHPFTVVAASADNPALTALATGVLIVGSFVEFALDLVSPRQVADDHAASYVVRVANGGNARLVLALGASDEAGVLDCAFDEPRVGLAPGEQREVRVVARLREVRLDTTRATHQITIAATMVEGAPPNGKAADAETRTVPVIFQQMPADHEPPRLEPERVELAGQTAQTSLVLANLSAVAVEMELSGADKALALAFEFAGGTRISVPGGQTLRVPLRITCLDRTRLAPHPAPTEFSVTVTPIRPAGAARATRGEVALPAAPDVRLRLDPEWVQWPGHETGATVVVANRGGRTVTVLLEADDKAHVLTFEFVGGTRQSIPAGQALDVPLRIARRLDTVPPITEDVAFTVTATPTEPAGESHSAEGKLAFPRPPDFRSWLEPERVHGNGPAQTRVVVENLSHRNVTFAVSTRSRDEGLVVSADSTQVLVPAQDRVGVPLRLVPRRAAPGLPSGEGRPASDFVVSVAPVDAPTAVAQASGSYVFVPAKLAVRLQPKEVEAVGAAAYAVRIENGGDGDVAVELEAWDRTGACAFAFDPPQLTIPPRTAAQVRLVATAPPEHDADARWLFEVVARPTSPLGDAVHEEGIFVYRPPELGFGLVPSEHRSRRSRRFVASLHNPTGARILARLAVVGSDDLEVRLSWAAPSGPMTIPPNGTIDVPLEVTPRRRSAGGERSASFAITATSVSPPGAVRTAQGRFVILPPRRWPSMRWPLLLALLAALGVAVRADVLEFGTAVLLLGPFGGGLVLRSWRWLVVCVVAFAGAMLALSLDDSAARPLRLAPDRSLDRVLEIDDQDFVADVRRILPPGAERGVPGVGNEPLSRVLTRLGVSARGSLDATTGELLDSAVVVATLAAAGTVVGKRTGALARRVRT